MTILERIKEKEDVFARLEAKGVLDNEDKELLAELGVLKPEVKK